MNIFRSTLVFLSISSFLFFSCESDSHVESGQLSELHTPISAEGELPDVEEPVDEGEQVNGNWQPAKSLDDIAGIWECSNGFLYEYPFKIDGKKYMRIAWGETDDTRLWQSFAINKGYDLQTLWKIRFACLSDIYGENLPSSDALGTQLGLKLKNRNGRIYARKEMLISEKLLIVNLNFFVMSPSKESFIENGKIHLASDVFSDLSKGGNIYRKKKKGVDK